MRMGVKMRVTSSQNKIIQNMVFENGGEWYDGSEQDSHIEKEFLFIFRSFGIKSKPILSYAKTEEDFFKADALETSAEIFIRTNGTYIEQRVSKSRCAAIHR